MVASSFSKRLCSLRCKYLLVYSQRLLNSVSGTWHWRQPPSPSLCLLVQSDENAILCEKHLTPVKTKFKNWDKKQTAQHTKTKKTIQHWKQNNTWKRKRCNTKCWTSHTLLSPRATCARDVEVHPVRLLRRGFGQGSSELDLVPWTYLSICTKL